MGYVKRASGYTHRERQAIFVGDLLNRGNAVEKVIKLVRRMQDSGAAQVVMGNHEFNTLAYHIPNPNHKDVYLRPRSKKNQKQLSATLNQLSKDEIESTLAWIRGLPMYLDLPEIRVVHACWDPWAIKRIVKAHAEFGQWTDEFMHKALDPGKKLAKAIEWTLKGKEQSLPMGEGLTDLDGFYRSRLRVRWYLPPEGKTYAEYALVRDNDLPQIPLPAALDGQTHVLTKKARSRCSSVTTDYVQILSQRYLLRMLLVLTNGVARGDVLCAYRWDGEQVLEADHLVWVKV